MTNEKHADLPPEAPAPASVVGEQVQPSPAADDREDERVPLQVRRSGWFRSIIGIFVLAFLAMIGGAVRFAVMHQWVAFGVLLTFSLCFGVIVGFRAAGYGWDDDKPEGGGIEELAPIPEEVRKNRWWRAALWGWLVWAIISSAEAVVTGVKHLWLAFAGGLLSAVVSWIRLAVARAGYVPPDLEP